MTQRQPTTSERIAALEEEIAAMRKVLPPLAANVKELHDALMSPEPGERDSLLVRMAIVTRGIESGQRVGRILIWLAGVLAAIGAVAAAVRFNTPTTRG